MTGSTKALYRRKYTDWQHPLWPLMKLSNPFSALNPDITLSSVCSQKFSWLSTVIPRIVLDLTTFNFSSPRLMSIILFGSFPSGVTTKTSVLSAATDVVQFLHQGFRLEFRSLLVFSLATAKLLWLDQMLTSSAYSVCFPSTPSIESC